MTKIRAVFAGIACLVSVAALAACSPSQPAAVRTGTCLGSAASATPAPGDPAISPVPDLALDCLDGSGPVRLTSVVLPTVVNLWATWCPACKKEIPAVQAFARSASGKVAVIGVDSGDSRSFGRGYVADKRLTYPMLFDPDLKLSSALGRHSLPLTLFVRPGGGLAYVYAGPALDAGQVADLAQRYLGVQVRV